MSRHTPGAWKAVEGGFGRHWCVIGSKHQLIGDDVVAGADARLIAAAPELYEAAKAVCEFFEAPQIEDELYRVAARKVLQAVAKAEGRS